MAIALTALSTAQLVVHHWLRWQLTQRPPLPRQYCSRYKRLSCPSKYSQSAADEKLLAIDPLKSGLTGKSKFLCFPNLTISNQDHERFLLQSSLRRLLASTRNTCSARGPFDNPNTTASPAVEAICPGGRRRPSCLPLLSVNSVAR